MKRLIGDYNGMSTSVFMSITEALSVGVIESKLGDLGLACASIATGSRRQILDAYLLLHRSEEELKMLHQEFNNLLNYYKKMNTVITVAIAKFSNYDDKLSNGAVAMLTKLLQKNNHYLCQADVSFLKLQSSAEVAVEFDDDTDLSGDDEDEDDDWVMSLSF